MDNIINKTDEQTGMHLITEAAYCNNLFIVNFCQFVVIPPIGDFLIMFVQD